MTLKTITSLFLILFIIIGPSKAHSQSVEVADRIVAQVNEHVILKSDIDLAVADYIRQAQFNQQDVEFSKEMWYSFLEAEIDKYVLLEKARIDSITVSDARVEQQMDNRINQLVQRAGSEQALEDAFGKSIIQLKEDFREQFREQMIMEQVQQQKYLSIQVTRPEVREFFESIPKDSLPTIPEQVAVSHIVALPPPLTDAKQAAYEFAELLRDSLINHGASFEELARRHSQGPSAPRGGLLPMMGLDELVPEYSAAAAALQPGEISEVVETQFGFHIIRLNKRVGDQIETSHILIKIDSGQLDDQAAIDKLNAIRDSLLTDPSLSFSQMAMKHSEDPSTAPSGGKIVDPQTGERLISLTRLDPSLYRVVLLMDEVGQISEPRPFTLNNEANGGKAYRIVRLDELIPEHVADFDIDYDRLKSIVLQQKRQRVFAEWMQDLRDEFYIEYRIPKLNQPES